MSVNPHPELPPLEFIQPTTLAEASHFLSQHAGQARPLAGGTDVFVRLRDGVWRSEYLVDIKRLEGTQDLAYDPAAGLRLGAAVSMNRMMRHPAVQEHYPLLAEAARTVASYQLRSRATVAGNICNASPAGDTIGACLVLGGRLLVHGAGGLREESLEGFFLGPGKTRLQPGDIVVAVLLPPPAPGAHGRYIKLGRNQMSDLSIIGVTAYGAPDASLPSGYRFGIALASVAPIPLRPTAAEAFLAEHSITQAVLEEAARLAQQAATPISDVRGTAAYRKRMAYTLTYRALWSVWEGLDHRRN